MKQFCKICLPVLATLIFANCGKWPGEVVRHQQPVFYEASRQIVDGQVKTTLGNDGEVLWNESDAISLLTPEGENSILTDPEVAYAATVARFTSYTLPAQGNMAIYPADASARISAGGINLALPSHQDAVAGGFDPAAALSVSDASTTSLKFKNVVALLGITVRNADLESATLTLDPVSGIAPAGEALVEWNGGEPSVVSASGPHSVVLEGEMVAGSTYYFAVFPGTYGSLELTLRNKDGREAVYTNGTDLEAVRSERLMLADLTVPDSRWEGGDVDTLYTWIRLTETSQLTDGSKVIIAEPSSGAVAGPLGSQILSAVGASFSSDYSTITAFSGEPLVLTASGGSATGWTLTDSTGRKLGVTAVKKLAWNSGTTKWYLSITSGVATISTSNSELGNIQYNSANPRFTTYASAQKAISLYCRVVAGTTPAPGPNPNPPTPGPGSGGYGWFELPLQSDADGNGIDDADSDLYYSHTFRADAPAIRNFSACYSKSKRHPVWVAAPMHSSYRGNSGRTNAYTSDPAIGCQQSSKFTGYTRGHMIGSSDRTISKATNRQVFYYSNIGAQLSSYFNTGGGAWNSLEERVDGYWCSDTLYQVVGCIFDTFTDRYGRTVAASVGNASEGTFQIPTAWYKVLLRTRSGNSGKSVAACSAGELQCVAFILGHYSASGRTKPSTKDMYSVSELEALTGLTFFVNVPNAPKNSYTPSEWGF